MIALLQKEKIFFSGWDSSVSQLEEITSRGILEYPQFEFWQNGQNMVKDIRLYGLVLRPGLIVTEDIDLHGHALFCGLQVPHQEGHVLMDFWMAVQIFFQVFPEGSQVGHLASVGDHVFLQFEGLVEFGNFFFLLDHVVL